MKKVISMLTIVLLVTSCEKDPASTLDCATLSATMVEKSSAFEANSDSTTCAALVSAAQGLLDNSCSVPSESETVEITAEDIAELQGECNTFNPDFSYTDYDEVPVTTNNIVGTWSMIAQEMGQTVTTNSQQTSVPLMGHLLGIAPFEGGIVASGDINETFNHMMPMGFGGLINKSTLEMGMIMEQDSTTADVEFCMLMLPEDDDEFFEGQYVDMDYNCLLSCGSKLINEEPNEGSPADEEPPTVYVGNVEVQNMDIYSDTMPDFSTTPFMSIVGSSTLSYMDMETGALDNSRTVTISGSVSFKEVMVNANTPTDLIALQIGISLDDMMNMMGDIDMEIPISSVTFNADGTYSTHEEHTRYEYDSDTDTETQYPVTLNCTGTWEVNSMYGIKLGEEEECSDSSEEGENGDEGYGGGYVMQTFVINSGGYLVVSQSTNSFCAVSGGFDLEFDGGDYYDGDDYDVSDEEECKQELEQSLAFDAGSLASANIHMSMIYSPENSPREIYFSTPRNIELKAILRHLKRHNRKILPPWALN